MRITITPEAKREIEHRLARLHAHDGGLMVLRTFAKADLTRSAFGEAKWSVERPEPWSATVISFGTIAAALASQAVELKVQEVDGVQVGFLALEEFPPLQVELHGKALHVRERDA
jgi:hypothetical protein